MSENQKKIWITGASSGIGKAVAEKFAAEGWKVAVSARRKELLQELATNENIVSFPLDVTDQTQINTVFKNIISEFGNLDLCLFYHIDFMQKGNLYGLMLIFVIKYVRLSKDYVSVSIIIAKNTGLSAMCK